MTIVGWRPGWKRLRRRVPLAGRVAPGDRSLLHRPDRLAGYAIEDVEECLLGRLGERLDRLPVHGDVGQDWRGRNVHVPQSVVHQLEMPQTFACPELDGDDAFAEQVVAGPIPAVIVAGRHLDRQVRDPELFIDGDLRPDARVARVGGGLVLPCVRAELAGARDGVEGPEPLARPHVEAADVSLDVPHALRVGTRGVRGAHDHDVPGDHRRGVEPDLSGDQIDLLIEVALQVDDAILTEGGDARPGPGVEGYEPVPGRDVQNPLLLAVAPVGEPSAGQLSRGGGAARTFVLAVHPEQLARGGVERDRRAPRAGGGVEHALHHQRRRLELKFGARTEAVGLEAPGHF